MASKHNILVVDDAPDMLESSRAVLDAAGYKVATALGGKGSHCCFKGGRV